MIYKIIQLKSIQYANIKTEIMYEVASAHAAGTELLRVNIAEYEDEALNKRIMSSLIRILKAMKSSGSIQFYATAQSFELGNTEAQFLLNKYPEIFEDNLEERDDGYFVYVRA